MTPCISILDIEGTPHAACGEKICFQLVKQIHPDNLGIYVNKADGLKAVRVLTRAIELCILDAEFSAYRATGDPNAVAELGHAEEQGSKPRRANGHHRGLRGALVALWPRCGYAAPAPCAPSLTSPRVSHPNSGYS